MSSGTLPEYMSGEVVGTITSGWDQTRAEVGVTASKGEFEGLVMEVRAPSTAEYILAELDYTATCDLITRLTAGAMVLWGPDCLKA